MRSYLIDNELLGILDVKGLNFCNMCVYVFLFSILVVGLVFVNFYLLCIGFIYEWRGV